MEKENEIPDLENFLCSLALLLDFRYQVTRRAYIENIIWQQETMTFYAIQSVGEGISIKMREARKNERVIRKVGRIYRSTSPMCNSPILEIATLDDPSPEYPFRIFPASICKRDNPAARILFGDFIWDLPNLLKIMGKTGRLLLDQAKDSSVFTRTNFS